MRVLVVVEDDRDMRMLVRMTLGEDASFELGGEADTAEEALAEARRLMPDLIVLDNFLDGEITGLEVAPEIKAIVPEAKIILFSSYDLEEQVRDETAVDAFVRKDHLRELLPTARRLLGLSST